MIFFHDSLQFIIQVSPSKNSGQEPRGRNWQRPWRHASCWLALHGLLRLLCLHNPGPPTGWLELLTFLQSHLVCWSYKHVPTFCICEILGNDPGLKTWKASPLSTELHPHTSNLVFKRKDSLLHTHTYTYTKHIQILHSSFCFRTKNQIVIAKNSIILI